MIDFYVARDGDEEFNVFKQHPVWDKKRDYWVFADGDDTDDYIQLPEFLHAEFADLAPGTCVPVRLVRLA
jgi:hypothetical protein